MSANNYNYEIGYEGLRTDFKRYQKQSPKGVSLKQNRNTINLQFKIGKGNRKPYGCNCSFTLDGMVSALNKAHKVAEALKSLKSETEFWEWYDRAAPRRSRDREIKDIAQVENDLLTFRDAIALRQRKLSAQRLGEAEIAIVENDFWSRTDRRKQKRSESNSSDLSSWYDTYNRFYKHLPQDQPVNAKDIIETLSKWNKGTKSYKSATSVFKKLARVAKKKGIVETLDNLDITQTEFNQLQSATLLDFLNWRNKTLGITEELDSRCNLNVRKAWLWAFSIQIVYGLRIHEVFAIENLTEAFTMKDGVIISALNDETNKDNLLVIGKLTNIGTKTKTYERLARPLLPSKYPELIDLLEIKKPLLPSNKPKSNISTKIINFYNGTARSRLIKWNAPFTQTHALRHLANLNGMQAGISLEVRAQSLGTYSSNE